MNPEQGRFACQLIDIAQHEIKALTKAIKGKDLGLAKIISARLETDITVINSLLQKEK